MKVIRSRRRSGREAAPRTPARQELCSRLRGRCAVEKPRKRGTADYAAEKRYHKHGIDPRAQQQQQKRAVLPAYAEAAEHRLCQLTYPVRLGAEYDPAVYGDEQGVDIAQHGDFRDMPAPH